MQASPYCVHAMMPSKPCSLAPCAWRLYCSSPLALLLTKRAFGTRCRGQPEAVTAAETSQHCLEELSGTPYVFEGMVVVSRHACFVKALRSSSKATSALPRTWTAWAAWEAWAGAPQPANTCHWLPQT